MKEKYKMDKMKKFIECYVPISACNMRCKYCYVTQNEWWNNKKPDFSFEKKIKEAFSQDRLGGSLSNTMAAPSAGRNTANTRSSMASPLMETLTG